jgi:polyhydroxybutyrate depolymerase
MDVHWNGRVRGRRGSFCALATAFTAIIALAGTVAAGASSTGAATTTTTSTSTSFLQPESGSYVFTLKFDGLERDYRLHVPPAAASGKPLPLVLNLHGATQNAELEEITSDMDPNADMNGYLVAYPDGTRISKVLTPDPIAKNAQYGWNAGMCCGLPVTKKINDVGFLLKVISAIASKTPVDLRRVYMTGISNGGMMAYAMAAEASDHVAAISSISGQVEIPVIHPTRSVPTMEFHSVNDPIAKFDGTPSKNPKLRLSVMEGIDQWVKADDCQKKPTTGATIVGAAGSISAGETATPITYAPCRSGAEVALWRFTGSGHVWPGSTLNTGPKKTWILAGVGRGIILVNANETMWQFFEKYSLPSNPR